jgi:hypothetical protein
MMEPKNLDKMNELQGYACLGVSMTVKLKAMTFSFIENNTMIAFDGVVMNDARELVGV